jgi:hypothetical protein
MRVIIFLIAFFFLMIVISCGNNTKLLGRWANANKTIDCEFLEGNKYAFAGENPFRGNPSTGTFQFKNDTLSFYAETFDSAPKTKPYFKTKVTFFNENEITFGDEPLSRKK